jgi:hypothetical protein
MPPEPPGRSPTVTVVEAVRERLVARMAAAGLEPASQHPYRQANRGVTYRDRDGREVVFVSWVYGTDWT